VQILAFGAFACDDCGVTAFEASSASPPKPFLFPAPFLSGTVCGLTRKHFLFLIFSWTSALFFSFLFFSFLLTHEGAPAQRTAFSYKWASWNWEIADWNEELLANIQPDW
jgi:hypothetical protein